jgi:hypothetical protein
MPEYRVTFATSAQRELQKLDPPLPGACWRKSKRLLAIRGHVAALSSLAAPMTGAFAPATGGCSTRLMMTLEPSTSLQSDIEAMHIDDLQR